MINILIFIVVLAILVLVHEFGHFFAARKFNMLVEEFGFGFPPKIKGWKKGETLWSINAIPIGGFVKIAGEDGQKELENKSDDKVITPSDRLRFFSSKPIWQRAIVLISGVLMNFILGWVILVIVFLVGTKPVVIISNVSNNSPAYNAGLKQGDQILGFLSAEEFANFINNHKGQKVTLEIVRNGEQKKVDVVPRVEVPLGEGPLGVGLFSGGFKKESFFEAVVDATKTAFEIFAMIYVFLFRLILSIFGGPNVFEYVSGPIGIFKATSQAANLGFIYLANLVALISLNLAAINIFPFPALDGGRLLFLAIEKIKGSPVSIKVQQIVNGAGFALLLVLMIAASIQDVIRIFK
jgi:regulator of sigma E protease